MRCEPVLPSVTTRADERGAALALLPIAATLDYYALPVDIQAETIVQFIPQLISYLALALWIVHNGAILSRIGLEPANLPLGLKIGFFTGLALGSVNTLILLRIFPHLGYDIAFLKDTPHGQLPVFVMVPWFIVGIAVFVEVNFRGFLLGRLISIEANSWRLSSIRRFSPVALLTSSLVFTFDPFMVNTFHHLHWIALWDGLIWGLIRLRTGNLYATITAHAVEVVVMYSAVRFALTP